METVVSMNSDRLMAENLMWVTKGAVIKNPIRIITHSSELWLIKQAMSF
jgi:hypothetical protein